MGSTSPQPPAPVMEQRSTDPPQHSSLGAETPSAPPSPPCAPGPALPCSSQHLMVTQTEKDTAPAMSQQPGEQPRAAGRGCFLSEGESPAGNLHSRQGPVRPRAPHAHLQVAEGQARALAAIAPALVVDPVQDGEAVQAVAREGAQCSEQPGEQVVSGDPGARTGTAQLVSMAASARCPGAACTHSLCPERKASSFCGLLRAGAREPHSLPRPTPHVGRGHSSTLPQLQGG